MMRLTRREMLTGLAATGAWLGAAPFMAVPARAQALTLGYNELLTVSDGTLQLPISFSFPDAPQDELVAVLSKNGMPTDVLVPDCNVTILRSADRLVIFDVGAGANFMPTAGELLVNLEAQGIDPADVTDVVFTHAHPDHLWGLTDDFDELVFPEAAYHIGQAEWDYWSSADTLANVPETMQSFVVGAQNRFDAISDRVNFVSAGVEVLPGIEAMDTGGHTPGHLSFIVHGSEPVMILGDALSNSVISVEHPDWPAGMDQDPQKAIETRKVLLDRLATDRIRLIGYHFPHPGTGRIEKTQAGFTYVKA